MKLWAVAAVLILGLATGAPAKRPSAAGTWAGNFFQGWYSGRPLTSQDSRRLEGFMAAKKSGCIYVLKLLPGKPRDGYYEAGQFILYTLVRGKLGLRESSKESGTWLDNISEIQLLRTGPSALEKFYRIGYCISEYYPGGMLEYDRIGGELSDSDILARASKISWHYAHHPKFNNESYPSAGKTPRYTPLPVSGSAPLGWLPNSSIRKGASLMPDSILRSAEFRFLATDEEKWVGKYFRSVPIKSASDVKALRNALELSCRRSSVTREPDSSVDDKLDQDRLTFNAFAEHGQKGNRILDFWIIRNQVHNWGPAFEKLYRKYYRMAFPGPKH
ncbi:MAG TPA: hypothetical protein VGL56_14610 [Fimbriimonadaceae bacterium]|jgi:hypothetical protein